MIARRGGRAPCLAAAIALAASATVCPAAMPASEVLVPPATATAAPQFAARLDASLARGVLSGEREPELLLAERAIERDWGPSEDSTYTEVNLPEWRSESAALALSAAVPGAGQLYAGETRGWWFALAEAVGWTTRWIYIRRGRDLKDDASSYAGVPSDTTSRWSVARWQQATGGDAEAVRALYAKDPDVFYDLIARDPRYLAGWSDDPAGTRATFSDLRRSAEDRLRYARYTGTGLWINHVVAAFDALRAARLRDVSLGRDTRLRLRSGWNRGGPELAVAVRRSF